MKKIKDNRSWWGGLPNTTNEQRTKIIDPDQAAYAAESAMETWTGDSFTAPHFIARRRNRLTRDNNETTTRNDMDYKAPEKGMKRGGPTKFTRGSGGKYMKHGGVVERQSGGPVGGYGKAMRGRGKGKVC